MQAHRLIRKGVECALLYVRVLPQQSIDSVHNVSQVGSALDSQVATEPEMEPKMKALVEKY